LNLPVGEKQAMISNDSSSRKIRFIVLTFSMSLLGTAASFSDARWHQFILIVFKILSQINKKRQPP
jgi:hypothetical protein